MRILFVCDTNCQNPFVVTLAKALNQQGVEAVCSSSELFTNTKAYDIFHFQWPEAIFNWQQSVTQQQLSKLETALRAIKAEKKKILITCHNLKPHTITDENVYALYDAIYRYCDVFIHLGKYSRDILQNQYPNARHEILPHHIYDELYADLPSREEACRFLNISPQKRYILCIGAFRTEEEKHLLEYVAKHLQKGTAILAPSFAFKSGKRFSYDWFNYHIKKDLIYANRIIGHRGYVSNQDIAYYMAVSDVTFIQRLKILNSGNFTLGMYAGNVIVGPDCGHVGQNIKDTGNFTFNPKDIRNIPSLINQAFKAYKEGLGNKNKQYAQSHWNSNMIARQLIEIYEK